MPPTAPPHQRNGYAAPDEAGFFAPRLGPEGEQCGACGAPLAADQRYCLACGERRAATRVPFPAAAAPAAPVVVQAPAAVERRSLSLPVWSGLAGVAAVSLGILAGVVLMNAREDDPVVAAAIVPTPTAAATVAATPPPAAATPDPAAIVAPATFTPDWPAGTDGWTVQLQTLPKDGTTPEAVATAKSDATAQGAADVGALDADEYPSLDGGQYVVYSTVSTSKADAEAILDGIAANFPDAKVVEVSQTAGTTDADPEEGVKQSDAELEKKEKTQTPEEAQKKLRDAPDKSTTEGDPLPEADDKEPGGGSETTEF
ncbi:hypothetical protein OJ998_34470 [Solirubrobacter taibaiensis]|nr:hypothetical protein [Solirubrobacter taibaiensis]